MALVKRRGFQFDETMSGTYTRVDAPAQKCPLSFRVRAQNASARSALKSGQAYLQGTIRAEGLADAAPAEGTMELSLAARRIRYELSFPGNDGQTYRFEGKKRLRFPNLVRSLTDLEGDIINAAGGVVATAELAFDVRGDLLPFLASWRPA